MLKFKTDDELFNHITSTFRAKITTWEYFVNWQKVFGNVHPIEVELNILNYLIGKDDIEAETIKLVELYPDVISAFPFLLAMRENSIEVLTDVQNFITKKYNFKRRQLSHDDVKDLAEFILKSGLGAILVDRKVKNLVDYVAGVEVGLDSNGRKNRGGTMMEKICEVFIKDACEKLGAEYLKQANAVKIKNKWGIKIEIDKSSRIIDFVINKNSKLYFIEVNFYGGGGSKLKSTVTEYISMHRYWTEQNIDFIWITDGAGWHSTLKPLREYFDKGDYLGSADYYQDVIKSRSLAIFA